MIEAKLARMLSQDCEFYQCIKCIDSSIEAACAAGQFSASVNLDEKHKHILNKLVDYYRGLGYQVSDDFKEGESWVEVTEYTLNYMKQLYHYVTFVVNCED